MDFYKRAGGAPNKLAIFPGAFNPPTRAHMRMAEMALGMVDEVVFVLPRVFPHKQYGAAGFDERLDLLVRSLGDHPRFSLAASDGGLCIDLAQQARIDYSPETELVLLCGRDAAERIVSWDYGADDPIEKQLEVFRLLVASRAGLYAPPDKFAHRVATFSFPLDEISSTEVRRRIGAGEDWRELVPESAADAMESQLALWTLT